MLDSKKEVDLSDPRKSRIRQDHGFTAFETNPPEGLTILVCILDKFRTDAHVHVPTVEALTQIWQRVLERNPIGSEENFFDLGGDDRLADLLFAEIALMFGRRLPSATIGYAPTIAALAALLEQPTLPAFQPIVQMKHGSRNPPIFMVPGLGGGAAELCGVARRIQTEHPIYGTQAKGIDGREGPLERVEDMAGFYLAALEKIEPRGPYILIGFSFGGLVALEMAQRLSKIGKHVALLMVLDAYPDARFLAPVQRLHLIAQRVKFHLEAMRRLPLPDLPHYFVRKLKARRRLSTIRNETAGDGEIHGPSFAQTSLRLEQKAYLALVNYRPRFYCGKINFVVAADTKSCFLPPNPTSIWGAFAEEFELDSIPGDHLEMVTRHFEALASVLTRHIQEATS